jgi:hypothetical protein
MNSTLCARQYARLSGVSKPLADSISCPLYLQPCRVATPNCVCINFNHEMQCARLYFTSRCLWCDAVSSSDLVRTFQRIINTFDFVVKPSSWNVSWWSGWYKDPSKLQKLLAQTHTFNINVVRASILARINDCLRSPEPLWKQVNIRAHGRCCRYINNTV